MHCQGLRWGLVAETVQELNFTRIHHNLPLGPSPLKLQSSNRLQISKIVISFRSCQSDSAGGETDCCFPLCPLPSIPPKLGAFGRGRGGAHGIRLRNTKTTVSQGDNKCAWEQLDWEPVNQCNPCGDTCSCATLARPESQAPDQEVPMGAPPGVASRSAVLRKSSPSHLHGTSPQSLRITPAPQI